MFVRIKGFVLSLDIFFNASSVKEYIIVRHRLRSIVGFFVSPLINTIIISFILLSFLILFEFSSSFSLIYYKKTITLVLKSIKLPRSSKHSEAFCFLYSGSLLINWKNSFSSSNSPMSSSNNKGKIAKIH